MQSLVVPFQSPLENLQAFMIHVLHRKHQEMTSTNFMVGSNDMYSKKKKTKIQQAKNMGKYDSLFNTHPCLLGGKFSATIFPES